MKASPGIVLQVKIKFENNEKTSSLSLETPPRGEKHLRIAVRKKNPFAWIGYESTWSPVGARWTKLFDGGRTSDRFGGVFQTGLTSDFPYDKPLDIGPIFKRTALVRRRPGTVLSSL